MASAAALSTIKAGLTALTKMAVDTGISTADIEVALKDNTGYVPTTPAAPAAPSAPTQDLNDLKAIAHYAKFAAATAGSAAKAALYVLKDYAPSSILGIASAEQTRLYGLADAAVKKVIGDGTAATPVVGFIEKTNTAVAAVLAAADVGIAQPELEKARAFALTAIANAALVRAYAGVTERSAAAAEYANIASGAALPTLTSPNPSTTELNQTAIYFLRKVEAAVSTIDPTASPLDIPALELNMLKARAATVGALAYANAGFKATPTGGGTAQDIEPAILTAVNAALSASDVATADPHVDLAESKATEQKIQMGGASRHAHRRRTQKNRKRNH